MNQQLSTDSFSKLADGGFYGPEVMATLKRIFDLICKGRPWSQVVHEIVSKQTNGDRLYKCS